MTKRKIEYWVIPPEQDAEFVACMEEVLETYFYCHGFCNSLTLMQVMLSGREHRRTEARP